MRRRTSTVLACLAIAALLIGIVDARKKRGKKRAQRRAAAGESETWRAATPDGLDDWTSSKTWEVAEELAKMRQDSYQWTPWMAREDRMQEDLVVAAYARACFPSEDIPVFNWKHFFGAEQRQVVPFSMTEALAPSVRILTHRLSLPLTLIHSLQAAIGVEQLRLRRAVTIHVGGVNEGLELGDAPDKIFGALTRVLCHVEDIRLVLVGPEVPDDKHGKGAVVSERLSVQYVQAKYHEWANDNASPVGYSTPDVFVAFNAALTHRPIFQSWEPTLRLLVGEGVFSVFTATDERENNRGVRHIKLASSFEAPAAMVPFRNPFGSMLLERVEGHPDMIYASNAFSVAFRGSRPGATNEESGEKQQDRRQPDDPGWAGDGGGQAASGDAAWMDTEGHSAFV